MSDKIRIGICGYGNLGKGVELAITKNTDMELVGIFTRRSPEDVKTVTGAGVYSVDVLEEWIDMINVLIMCGGSATDLPKQVPEYARMFNTVDSFDTHAKIPGYFAAVNKAAKESETVSLISVGWDPGMFSYMRALATSILPDVNPYTFWGKGVSQGHSDAIRRIPGVKDARQYTIPVEEAMERVRAGENPALSTREKHTRECFVVAEEGADLEAIELSIKTMPNYFDEYNTTVHFISEEELQANHSGMPHGGSVIACGETGNGNKQVMEYFLKLDSNPEFTGSILVACARATYRMWMNGESGAKTIFDISPALMSPMSQEEMIEHLL